MRERTTTVKMDEKGRLYIPKPVREALGVEGQETNVEVTVRVEEHQLQDTEDDSEDSAKDTTPSNEEAEDSEGDTSSWLEEGEEPGGD